jgi:hypothetical protein
MANDEHKIMVETLYREVKEYNNFLFDYIKSLDTRCSTMMSVVAVVLVLYINIISALTDFVCSALIMANLIFYMLSFTLYGVSFIFIRRFYAAPNPVHLVDSYYGKPVDEIMINVIENAVQVSKNNATLISKRACLMKYGGIFFAIGFGLTLIILVLLIMKGG